MADPVDNDANLLLRRALAGDESALAALFDGYRDRLKKMIRLRLDRRLSGRVDSSDVLQDAYLDVRKRIAEYARDPSTMPFHRLASLRASFQRGNRPGARPDQIGGQQPLHPGPETTQGNPVIHPGYEETIVGWRRVPAYRD